VEYSAIKEVLVVAVLTIGSESKIQEDIDSMATSERERQLPEIL
jgi:hypothetical protein